mmetsp:Transcript_135390/g.234832  ORF Transcript_135390/g.234832 Transcript_135390/m.234832 type:complete len:89 (+) Transcript_135390:785-1051(+)
MPNNMQIIAKICAHFSIQSALHFLIRYLKYMVHLSEQVGCKEADAEYCIDKAPLNAGWIVRAQTGSPDEVELESANAWSGTDTIALGH